MGGKWVNRTTEKRAAKGSRVELTCESCGGKFLVTPSQARLGRKHCSHGCRNVTGAKNVNWLGGRSGTAAQQRYYALHPEAKLKRRARRQVSRALVLGDLKRQPCEVCGAENTHGHHDDYNKPLEVRWLCEWHHLEAHGQLPQRVTRADWEARKRDLVFQLLEAEKLYVAGLVPRDVCDLMASAATEIMRLRHPPKN